MCVYLINLGEIDILGMMCKMKWGVDQTLADGIRPNENTKTSKTNKRRFTEC